MATSTTIKKASKKKVLAKKASLPKKEKTYWWEKVVKTKYEPIELKPSDSLRKQKIIEPPRFATIDIETQDWINYVCGEVYWIDDKKVEHWKETNDVGVLLLECFKIASLYKINNFVAHYGGKFDFLFFMGHFITNAAYEVENIVPRGSSVLSFDVTIRQQDGIVYDFPLPSGKITFRDSSALLAFSLGSLTKAFNVETLKGEMDFLFIEDVYNERPYIHKILLDDRCSLFRNGKQIFKVTKAMTEGAQLRHLRYWNHERFAFFPFKGKMSKIKPYMKKKDKKGLLVDNDWFEELTYPIFTKKELLLYLHHDCKSLYQCVDAFFRAPIICLAKKKWTTASQSVEVFRMFLDKPLHSLPDDDKLYKEGNIDEFVRRAYFGGRTEIFKPVFDSEISGFPFLFCFDVNSLYPFCMMKHAFPDRFIRKGKGKKDYDKFEMGIWRCKVRVPTDMYMPVLAIKLNERLIFPVGEFEGYWTKYELDYAVSCGCEILEYIEGALFENAGFIFKEFVDTLYNMRLEAKEKKDDVTQMTMKLLMNSCYGRMGINKERSKIIIDQGIYSKVKFIADIETKLGTIRLSEKPEKAEKLFSNPVIACYVTSYARVHLHKECTKVGVESVYYTDTDSCFTNKEMAVGKELGAMKLEYKSKSACFLLPKTYVVEDILEDGKEKAIKLTMKGFDYKNIRNKFGVQDFLEYLGGESSKILCAEKPKFATFKTALRQGKFVTMKNDPVLNRENDERREREHFEKTGKKKRFVKDEYKLAVKQLKSHYTKREIIKNGFDTKPLLVNFNLEVSHE
jgi:hypothetical protein